MKTLTIRGANWKYKDLNTEQKEVVLLVHGHPFNHTMWKYQLEALSDFRLILPDLRGYGESDYAFDKIFIEEQALDLALLLDELQLESVHLMGLSMGGQIIVEFQRLFPQRVKSLVICASLPNAETAESYTNRLQLAKSIQQTGMLAYTKADIHKYINLVATAEHTAAYQHLFDMMSMTTIQGAVASHRGRAERRDNTSHLPSIAVPTLMVAGEYDYFFPIAEIEKAAQQIPNAQFEVVSASGHLPNLEKPVSFNKIITKFYIKHT